jgi:hypothetical protein
MSDLKELLGRQADLLQPSSGGLARTIERVRRRERRRRTVTGGVALGVGVLGTLVAFLAFSGSGNDRGRPAGANYEIDARLATPNDISGQPARGADFQWIHAEIRWSPDRYPGVRRCTWQVVDETGTVIGDRTGVYAPSPADSEGQTVHNEKVFPIDGEPAAAKGVCGDDRLDVPGIAEVDPIPRSVGWDELDRTLNDRVDAWARRYEIDEMSTNELAANLWALWLEFVRMETEIEGDPLGLRGSRELVARRGTICGLLPLGHEFRNDEFCDSGAELRDGDGPAPPAARHIIGTGEAGGTRWELFILRMQEGPALGFDLEPGEWGFTTNPDPQPCGIASDRIYWLHLREEPSSLVVLQFSPIPPVADSVLFRLDDGREVPARVLDVPDHLAPWDAFAVVFDGSREVQVSEIVIEDAAGIRLNDAASC